MFNECERIALALAEIKNNNSGIGIFNKSLRVFNSSGSIRHQVIGRQHSVNLALKHEIPDYGERIIHDDFNNNIYRPEVQLADGFGC